MGFPSETKRASLLLKVLFAFALTTLIQCTAKMINGTDDTFTPYLMLIAAYLLIDVTEEMR